MKEADFALVAAWVWPRAAWDEYITLTYLLIWLFAWDDEVDTPVGSLSSDFRAAQSFRNETVSFIKSSLGFGGKGASPRARNAMISSFSDITDPLRKSYTRGAYGRCPECGSLSVCTRLEKSMLILLSRPACIIPARDDFHD